MPRGRLFVVTGPSGVGKGTLIKELLKRVPGLELSTSATTRAPRPGEKDGVDYHFLTEEEFERRLGRNEFMEHAGYSGHRYGTLLSEVQPRLEGGTGVVLEIEVQGARQVRRSMPDAVLVFVAPPAPEALRERLEGRGTDTEEQIERRLRVAEEELEARREFGHVIVNDDVDRAAAQLAELVQAERAPEGAR
jgi:guanylate kinase